MDTAQTITHVSLCAGYGGIDLGLKRAIPNLRTIAFSEIEAFACANLVAKMEAGLLDAAPIWTDLKTFPWEEFRGKVDILSGGYPCQPFSAAGKRLGAEDPRHLWPYIADGIVRMQPRVCFFENVEGHITLGLRDVLHDLAGMGYRTTWGVASASEVGAPHQRKRVFVLAYRYGERGHLPDWWRVAAEQVPVGDGEAWRDGWPSRPGEPQHGWEPPRVVGNPVLHGHPSSEVAGGTCQGEGEGRLQEPAGGSSAMGNASQRENNRRKPGDLGQATGEGRCGDDAAAGAGEMLANAECELRPRRPERTGRWIGQSGEAQCDASGSGGQGDGLRQAEPPLGGDADGSTSRMDHAELYTSFDNRTDELRLLGNGVVPATAERAYRILSEELTKKGKL